MEKFSLFHVALYAKHWYKQEHGGNTIWDDLKVMFTLDDYQGEFMNKNDMVNVLLNHCQCLKVRAFTDLTQFVSGIAEENSFKFGYLTDGYWLQSKGEVLPKWDYKEAIVRYCLSNLSITDSKTIVGEGGKFPKPNYNMGIKRNKGVSDKALKDYFGGEVKV
jgi:hypothetical protein